MAVAKQRSFFVDHELANSRVLRGRVRVIGNKLIIALPGTLRHEACLLPQPVVEMPKRAAQR